MDADKIDYCKYFNDVFKELLVTIKPAYCDSSIWINLNIDEAIQYLEGMKAALTAITMRNL